MTASASNYDHFFQFALVGAACVGKSAFLMRFADHLFTESYLPTIGLDFSVSTVYINGETIRLQTWDYAADYGQEQLQQHMGGQFRDTSGFFIVYDITNLDSFEATKKYISLIRQNFPESLILLIGNKRDLISKRAIDVETAHQFAEQEHIPFMECSAKDDINVQKAFLTMAADVLEAKMKKKDKAEEKPAPEIKLPNEPKESYLSRNRYSILASIGASGLGGGLAAAFLTTAPLWVPFAVGGGVFLLFNLGILGLDLDRNKRNSNAVERAAGATAGPPSPTSLDPSHAMHRQFSRRELKDNAIFTICVNTINKRTVNITVRPTMTVKDFSELLFHSYEMHNLNVSTLDEFRKMNFFTFKGKSLYLSSSETLEKLGMEHLSKIYQVSDVTIQNSPAPSGQSQPANTHRRPSQR